MTHWTMLPIKDGGEMARAIRKAIDEYNALTPEQKEELHKKQRDSYVRAELDWPRDCPYR